MRATQTWLGLGALMFTLTGCSTILDIDKKQCKVDADCGEFNGKPIYSCEKNFCKTVSCTSDSECLARGDFTCEDSTCGIAICSKDADCTDGLACSSGRCVDPIFGCFNQQPPLSSEEPAVLKIPLFQFFGDRVPVDKLQLTVCDALDITCSAPIPNVVLDYTNTIATITGLSNGQRYVLRFTGEDGLGHPLLETDYIMQRPVVGSTLEVDSIQLVPEIVPQVFAGSAKVDYDVKKAIMVAQVFGCDNKPLAGVSVIDSRVSTLFYLTGEGPDPTLTETDETGQVGFINMDAADDGQPFTHKLTFKYKGQQLYSFAVQPRPGVLNFSLVYMPDFKTTTERAMSVTR